MLVLVALIKNRFASAYFFWGRRDQKKKKMKVENGVSKAPGPAPVELSQSNPHRLGKKRDLAAAVQLSVRTIDGLLSEGCPHVKLSPRCVRVDIPECIAWIKEHYSQQRLGKERRAA